MKTNKIFLLAGIFCIAIFGCSDTNVKMPEVNQENCQTDKINRIKDEKIRDAFAAKCDKPGNGITRFGDSPVVVW